MKALLRKELLELALPVLALFALQCLIWTAGVPDEALLWPHALFRGIAMASAALIGLLLGVATFAVERWRGTEDYLVHHGGGARDAFRAKALVGLGATALVGAGPALVVWARTALFSSVGPIALPERALELAALGTSGLPTFAAGALAMQLRRSWPVGAALALVGGVGSFVLPTYLPMVFSEGGWPAELVARDLLLALALCALAERLSVARLDRELALPGKLFAAALVAGLPLVVLPLVMTARTARWLVADELYEQYPRIGYDAQSDRWLVVGEDVPHAPEEPYADVFAYRPGERIVRVAAWRDVVSGLRPLRGFAEWYPLDGTNTIGVPSDPPYEARGVRFAVVSRFDERSGLLHRFVLERGGVGYAEPWPGNVPVPAIPSHEVLRKPDGGTFSLRTRVLGSVDEGRVACLVDPADGSLWTYAPTRRAPLERAALPNGDRFVALEFGLDPRLAPFDVAQPMGPWQWVRGERGVYTWMGAELMSRAPHQKVAFAGDRPEVGHPRLMVEGEHTVAPRVAVVDPATGDVLFEHAFAPRGPYAWGLAASLYATSLLGAPLASLRMRARSPEETPAVRVVAPGDEFADGAPTWLLAAHLALAAWLSWRIAGRMRARGAERWTVILAAAVVASGGPFAYLLARTLGGRAVPIGVRRPLPRGPELRLAPTSEPA